ncbi:MAG: phospho-sugar mutase [Sphaerochaetaceae bacterium]
MNLQAKEQQEIERKAALYIAFEQSPSFRQEIITALDENVWDDLYDRFYTTLAFGTAGIRGLVGGGTNRINPLMIATVTQGFANYLTSFAKSPTVVIAFDSRTNSEEFALQAALTLCANDIKVYLYDQLRPVPMLSFALRHLKATAGIVITASHNPSPYNGYKVYWSDGGQVTAPFDDGIVKEVLNVEAKDVKTSEQRIMRKTQMLCEVPSEVDEAYYQLVINSLKRKELLSQFPIKVAYTPLHGSGNIPVQELFSRLGINCSIVAEQEEPDGSFPTVSMPNPEDPQAMRLAIELGKNRKADMVLGTDPDADRLGIAIPTDQNKDQYQLLGGNHIAVLLVDYLLENWRAGLLDNRLPLVVKSLVTSDLVRKITESHNGQCIDVLTGFKYIAQEIEAIESSTTHFFLFGCEESFGYNALAAIRDKDAVSSAALAVEMQAYWHSQGISLQHRLEHLFQQHGRYHEVVLSYAYEGSAGKERIDQIMQRFRSLGVGDSFADGTIAKQLDLLNGTKELPPSDVIVLCFDNNEKLIIRPSGTEPKIKYYLFFTAKGMDESSFDALVQQRIVRYKSEL